MKRIRIGKFEDIEKVTSFLGQADVSTEGIDAIIDHFILMEDLDGKMVATLGIERLEQDGLLRSLVISPSLNQTHLLTLFKSTLSLAKQKELENLYLATNKQSSVSFFEMIGFSTIEEQDLPAHIRSSNHISQLFETTEPRFMSVNVEKYTKDGV